RKLLRDSPAALWVHLHAQVVAAGAYERAGRQADRLKVLKLAEANARGLKRHDQLPDAVLFRWVYFRELNREAEVVGELRRATARTDHAYVAFYLALTLYRQGRLSEALTVLKGRSSWCGELLRILAEAESQKPGWRERAGADYDALESQFPGGNFFAS